MRVCFPAEVSLDDGHTLRVDVEADVDAGGYSPISALVIYHGAKVFRRQLSALDVARLHLTAQSQART